MAAKNDKPSVLTPRETEILVAAFVSQEEHKMDFEKFIKYSGFANANSARSNWNPLKKRILEMAGEDGLDIPVQSARKRKTKADEAPAATSKKPRATKKAQDAEEDSALKGSGNEDEEEAVIASPVPAKKRRAPKKAQNDQAKAPTAAKKRAAPKKAKAVEEEVDQEGEGDGEEDEAAESF
ncbi:hypothetical protein PFICI_03464 [Pestalotiopsis fici W106-1]|uniref:Uncharacterized protein n=1 Tax=Pestalotiopsis fici (strain W106-1 / CGMCC3.15140) TaxID=1229662 RepID=W3XHG8_PESFW|nr:uncharacterized protein PFICI_03464 [Pestalotiopsis fici W106-1]ETS85439.1 hypothetical protein PFICI_03464 [Pestalotiopsis fici W106-1]